MLTPSATTAAGARHQWHMRFDRVRCRTCDVLFSQDEDAKPCTCAGKIRPLAGMRNPIKPDFSRHPKLKKASDRWQAGERT